MKTIVAADLDVGARRRIASLPGIEMVDALERAEIIVCRWPIPASLSDPLPALRWLHYLSAGACDLRATSAWSGDAVLTTSRGYTNNEAIAAYVLRAITAPARVAIIGMGGAGNAVAAGCTAAGVSVIPVRRGDALKPALAAATHVVVCCQLTPETHHLLDAGALGALPPGAVVINVARAGVIDHAALLDALDSGRVSRAVLDVIDESAASAALRNHPRAEVTPHIAGGAVDIGRLLDLFARNLSAFLAGAPLENEVDRARGY